LQADSKLAVEGSRQKKKFKKISRNFFEFCFEFNFCEISYQVAELWQLTKAEQLWQILQGFENCPCNFCLLKLNNFAKF
jgi:hypothetical protein